MTESMSVLTARSCSTGGVGSSVAADDGDPSTSQEAVSSQSLANAIENIGRTRMRLQADYD